MQIPITKLLTLFCGVWSLLDSFAAVQAAQEDPPWQWEILSTQGKPTARHEAAFVEFEEQLYLIGGRGIKPVDRFNPHTNTWQALAKTPIEIHHFQPVVYKDAIYLVGAMTGNWPNEKGLDRVLVYYPHENRFEFTHPIPEHRRRGGAGAVLHNGKIYLVGGISNGHNSGFRSWLDEYNPETGEWRALPDAPHARDHFQAVVVNNTLFAFAGRRSATATGKPLSLVVEHGNAFDFDTETWRSVTDNYSLPILRAGAASFAWHNEVIIGGGEGALQVPAYSELDAFNVASQTWRKWPPMQQGRHGSGYAIVGDYVYAASGSLNRGGGPELETIERLKLPKKPNPALINQSSALDVIKRWHTFELNVAGPHSSEMATDNPFLNYRLLVTFVNGEQRQTVRGYYAADGNAQQTGAMQGNVWQVKFKPNETGVWHYTARLEKASDIGLTNSAVSSQVLVTKTGAFRVIETDREAPDFRASGYLNVKDSFFYFPSVKQYWLKGGTNSPENLLAFEGIDGTYRRQKQRREGEAKVDKTLHKFLAHEQDWQTGDPTFRNGKGKALFGAMNYLANQGMNAAYFLVMNINGDGNDVWPYTDPDDVTRFDVSRLAQWDQLFQHMQSKGIMLHLVTQETENERLLDAGDTGANRRLFYFELIARFGYHLALTWNLGEENGYAEWAPPAQNDAQRKKMIDFLSQHDPFDHPILLHTHADSENRKPILDGLLGYPELDGLSLQQADRTQVAAVIQQWKQASYDAGNEWLITMDEIGLWDLGASTDERDPGHPSLRGDVLWGSLLSGGAGVEWYFGAHQPHNDLNSEDWRQRQQLWRLTQIAKDFVLQYLPWWRMETGCKSSSIKNYCLYEAGATYALYLAQATADATIDLRAETDTFTIKWYDPRNGGALLDGTVATTKPSEKSSIGLPPYSEDKDWVVLLKRATVTTLQQ